MSDDIKPSTKLGVIFANGNLTPSATTHSMIQDGDLLIAADGGLYHCRELGFAPDVLIGDFDSISKGDREELQASGAEIIQHPARKDYTDLELAIRYARDRGLTEVLVLGALGARWDQTLANLLLLTAADLSTLNIRLVDGNQEIQLLRGDPRGRSLRLNGQPGDVVSLLPLGGDASGITTQGLEYPLREGTLSFGATRGISNSLVKPEASIQLKRGLLLCVIIHAGENQPRT